MWSSFLLIAVLQTSTLAEIPAFDAGVTAFGELEYEDAMSSFQKVPTPNDPADVAVLSLWIGLCRAGVGDYDGAKADMVQALSADRTVTIPVSVSPRVVAIFDEAKASLPPLDTGMAPTVSSPASVPGSSALSPVLIGGGVGIAAGVVAGIGAAILTGAAFSQLAIVDDAKTFQDDASVALDDANTSAGLAIAVGSLGAVAVAAGITLVALALYDQTEAEAATTSAPP